MLCELSLAYNAVSFGDFNYTFVQQYIAKTRVLYKDFEISKTVSVSQYYNKWPKKYQKETKNVCRTAQEETLKKIEILSFSPPNRRY